LPQPEKSLASAISHLKVEIIAYPSGEVQVDFQGTKTSSPVVYREGVLAKSTIKSEGVSTEMTNEREASPPSTPSARGLRLA